MKNGYQPHANEFSYMIRIFNLEFLVLNIYTHAI